MASRNTDSCSGLHAPRDAAGCERDPLWGSMLDWISGMFRISLFRRSVCITLRGCGWVVFDANPFPKALVAILQTRIVANQRHSAV